MSEPHDCWEWRTGEYRPMFSVAAYNCRLRFHWLKIKGSPASHVPLAQKLIQNQYAARITAAAIRTAGEE